MRVCQYTDSRAVVTACPTPGDERPEGTGNRFVNAAVGTAVVVLGLGIALTAVARVRAAEAAVRSKDNLRPIGKGMLSFVTAYGFFPGNGGPPAEAVTTPDCRTGFPDSELFRWGYGDPKRAGRLQTGCWAYSMGPDRVTDGLAEPALAAEKAMDTDAVKTGGWYWGEPIIFGGSGGTGRKGSELLRDAPKRLETVVWMGEFGRTPRINGNAGRDHYPNACSVVLGGGGIKGGQVLGRTSKDGATVDERPAEVPDLLATIRKAIGVDYEKTNLSNIGRPIRVVEKSAKPLPEVLA